MSLHHLEGERMRGHEHDSDVEQSLRPKSCRPDEPVPAQALRCGGQGRRTLDAAGVLGLQRTVGNGATGALLAGQRSPVLDVVGSGGEPLAPDVRSDMEARLGHDFGDVRVHTDYQAHESAVSVGALAYTAGADVVFQQGHFDPSSTQGRTTLAHELTHVVQQRQGEVDGTPAPGGFRLSDPSDRFEREAEAAAKQAEAWGSPAHRRGDARALDIPADHLGGDSVAHVSALPTVTTRGTRQTAAGRKADSQGSAAVAQCLHVLAAPLDGKAGLSGLRNPTLVVQRSYPTFVVGDTVFWPTKFLATAAAGVWNLWSLVTGEKLDDQLADDLILQSARGGKESVEVPKEWVMRAPGWVDGLMEVRFAWLNWGAAQFAEMRYLSGERSGIDVFDSKEALGWEGSRFSAKGEGEVDGQRAMSPSSAGADQFWGINEATLSVWGTVSWEESVSDEGFTLLRVEAVLAGGRFRDRYDWDYEKNPFMATYEDLGLLVAFDVHSSWDEEGYQHQVLTPRAKADTTDTSAGWPLEI